MGNLLKKVLDFKKLGLFKKDSSVLGVDIGSSAIKVVQLKRQKGKAILETYGELALGPYADLGVGQATNLPVEKIVEATKDLFREANVTTNKAAISIPLKSSLLKTIEIPAMGEKQLQKVIPIEARKYIPVPISEVALDWWVVPSHEFSGSEDGDLTSGQEGEKRTEKLEVLLVAIHNGIIKKYNDIVSKMGVEASSFEVETFSAIRSVMSGGIEPTAILDIGAATTKLTIIDYGVVKISHTINRGSQDVTLALSRSRGISFEQAEKLKRKGEFSVQSQEVKMVSPGEPKSAQVNVASSAMEYVFHEVNRIILNYQKKQGRLISKIILTGGGSLMKGLVDIAKKNVSAEIVWGDAFAKTQSPAFLSDVLTQAGPEFAVAIGLALRELREL